MRKITALVDHIRAVTGLPQEQIHAYADKGELMPTGRHLGWIELHPDEGGRLAQIEAGVWKYDAVIQIERYAGDGPLLAALLLAWISDHDPERDGLADPEMDVRLNDADTCDLELACEFEERLVIREYAGPAQPGEAEGLRSGIFPFNGKRWVMAMPDLITAEAVTGLRGEVLP